MPKRIGCKNSRKVFLAVSTDLFFFGFYWSGVSNLAKGSNGPLSSMPALALGGDDDGDGNSDGDGDGDGDVDSDGDGDDPISLLTTALDNIRFQKSEILIVSLDCEPYGFNTHLSQTKLFQEKCDDMWQQCSTLKVQ